MSPMECRVIGRWRIVAADLRDRDHLDLCGPARLDIGADGPGEIAFGALQASLDFAYGHDDVAFDWEGDDDMHEVRDRGLPNSSRTARSRSNSSTIVATTPS